MLIRILVSTVKPLQMRLYGRLRRCGAPTEHAITQTMRNRRDRRPEGRPPPRGTPPGPPRQPRAEKPAGKRAERAGTGRAAKPREAAHDASRPHHAAKEARNERGGGGASYWLHGRHAVLAALRNPDRRILRLCATADVAQRLQQDLAELPAQVEVTARDEIARRLPTGAVHQGLAAQVAPLPELFLGDLVAQAGDSGVVVVLDQVTDPHNAGAILRSADAFGALGILTTDRHTPEETGALAKAASGALERVPLVRVTNLARGLRELKEGGFWIIGLSEHGTQLLGDAKLDGTIAIVLGAEGEGLRHLTEQHCDLLVRLPMKGTMPSLNVSNAAAIALYELTRASHGR
jgi:23S rRNA (guanosine2251-2'-O)-methyltransferase